MTRSGGLRHGGWRAASTRCRWLVAGLVSLGTAWSTGCDSSAPPPAESPRSEPATQAPAESWRFRPTLEEHLPSGAVAEPVLELSEPRQRTVLVLAAVLREGADHVEIERWTYEQIPNQDEGLRVVDEGRPVIRLQPGAPDPELSEIRRRVAAPGTVLTRPVGLDVAGPAKLVERLAAELAIARNPSAEPRARVRAAATVVRALDDMVALRANGIGRLATVLVPAPRPTVQSESERRATASFEVDGRQVSLGMQRKSDGWAIVSTEIPPAPPAPTTAVTPEPVAPE